MTELSLSEKIRYARHIILPDVGETGQLKLKSARVLVVGAGGLGSPVSLYLASAGVGKLGIVDFDDVELTNLQRQILYGVDDLKKSKADTAGEKLLSLNPEINIICHKLRLSADNVMSLFADYDIIVDGTDNFSTRYLVNDACVLSGKPNVYGSIYRFEGQLSVFSCSNGPCYRCLFPLPPSGDAVPNCAEGGVLGVLAGVVGCLQATEVIKLIIREGQPLVGKLLLYNALEMEFRKLNIKRKDDCPSCGTNPTITKPVDQDAVCQTASTVSGGAPLASEVEPRVVADILKNDSGRLVLLDVRNYNEVDLCTIRGSVHIPLSELPDRLSELDSSVEMVVYCRSGVRSKMAIDILKQSGFGKLCNLKGGILAWSDQVDSTIPKY